MTICPRSPQWATTGSFGSSKSPIFPNFCTKLFFKVTDIFPSSDVKVVDFFVVRASPDFARVLTSMRECGIAPKQGQSF